MDKIIIAIDGHSGCGKSTTAVKVAKSLNYKYIDTGAMYRAVTLFFLHNGIPLDDKTKVTKALEEISIEFQLSEGSQQIHLNGNNVEKEIRSMEVNSMVSPVAALSEVRAAMVSQQRKMGNEKGVVMDGRDIGTNVFPDADLKIFMTADLETRAVRRKAELKLKGHEIPLEEVVENLRRRDEIDSSREDAPLRMADDAVLLDTTNTTIDGQVNFILDEVKTVLT